MSDTHQTKRIDVLILAAGLGTRMKSSLAKVLHKLDGRPLINHVCRTATALAPDSIHVIIGHQGELVKAAVLGEIDGQNVQFAIQAEQLGTGDAVNAARDGLESVDSTLVILSGDVPMIKPETLASLVQLHLNSSRGGGAACTIMTVNLPDPTGYGRIVRDRDDEFVRIVEQKDATEEERAITEVNAGIYCFDTIKLFKALRAVQNNNAQGEYYLTDVPALLRDAGEAIGIFLYGDASEIEGVNNRVQLAEMEQKVRRRTISRLMSESGVTFVDPTHAYVSSEAEIGRDTIIYPNVTIEGATKIGEGCVVRPGTRISNSVIQDDVLILDNCLIVDSEVGAECSIGPMAHLRGHAKLEQAAKIGNFVELKKTTLGRGSKASHLSYLGDATIGEKTNIGAGTITCNYDGKNKHETQIGSGVRIGSDTMLIAPVKIGDNAVTGAGSVVTNDVDDGDLVVGVPARSKRK